MDGSLPGSLWAVFFWAKHLSSTANIPAASRKQWADGIKHKPNQHRSGQLRSGLPEDILKKLKVLMLQLQYVDWTFTDAIDIYWLYIVQKWNTSLFTGCTRKTKTTALRIDWPAPPGSIFHWHLVVTTVLFAILKPMVIDTRIIWRLTFTVWKNILKATTSCNILVTIRVSETCWNQWWFWTSIKCSKLPPMSRNWTSCHSAAGGTKTFRESSGSGLPKHIYPSLFKSTCAKLQIFTVTTSAPGFSVPQRTVQSAFDALNHPKGRTSTKVQLVEVLLNLRHWLESWWL